MEESNLSGCSFSGAKLAKANLRKANLESTDFFQANLSQADLTCANLKQAQLVQTQLAGTNLTAAALSGACIEDWNITTQTLFDRVSCQFVFMRRRKSGSHDNPHRKPDNWDQEFEDGDFADFIMPFTETLDLYHNRNVDPRAIAIAFKKLSDDNPDANLQIVAIETKGNDKFMLRVKTEENADKSDLNGQYTQTYEQIRGLPSDQQLEILLAEKDSRIQSLEKFVKKALNRPSFINVEQYQGHNMAGADNSIKVGGDMIGNALGDSNTIDIQLQPANLPQPDQVDIHEELNTLKQILAQL